MGTQRETTALRRRPCALGDDQVNLAERVAVSTLVAIGDAFELPLATMELQRRA